MRFDHTALADGQTHADHSRQRAAPGMGGVVWMNPPYDRRVINRWMDKLATHGMGIALVFARTETAWFHDQVWKRASSVFFFEGRLDFYTPQGIRANFNCGAPSCLA